MKKIKVAIVGVGNCAKSLVEGTQYYIENPDDKVGLMYPIFGGYTMNDLQFVIGFDVDKRKVGKTLTDALRALPNCAMEHVQSINNVDVVPKDAMVYSGPVLDGVAPHMLELPEDISFRIGAEPANSKEHIIELLKYNEVDTVLNYLPVGSREASAFYIDCAIEAGCNVVNCIPTYIDSKSAQALEQRFIDKGLTIVGSDMKSAFGSSRMSEVLQSAMLDAGLLVTQHIQMNMASNFTQGKEHIRSGTSHNTDFANMKYQERLKDKHISKERVLKGQNIVRDISTDGMTLYAGPSLSVMQKPGGTYVGSDNKVANFDIVAFGWAGARYEISARLSVQDSANSAGIVATAVRACRVANELNIVGYLRGPSAYSQKSAPVSMNPDDAKYEMDSLHRRIVTEYTKPQLKENNPKAVDLDWTFQVDATDYE